MEEKQDIFTEEDYEKLKKDGLSQEDINNINEMLALSDLMDELPEDIDAFLKKVGNYFPEDPVEAIKLYFDLPKKDPEFFKKLIALQLFVGAQETPIETTSVSDALRQIRYADNSQEALALKNRLLAAMAHANAEQKTEYMNEVKELSLDEKKQLADILKHK